MQLPAEIIDFMRDLERQTRERQLKAAQANPEAHKLTLVLAPGTSNGDFSYYRAGRDGRGAQVAWCFMCKPNAAGYYLVWRERATSRRVVRTQWTAWKTPGRAETEALKHWRKEHQKLNPRKYKAY